MAPQRKRRRSKKNDSLVGLLGIGAVLLVFLLLFLPQALDRTPQETQAPTEVTLPPNPFSPEDFSLDSQGYVTCSAAKTRLGIDVSEHQGKIDWQAVADAGIQYAYIRVGYRGYDQGGVYEDDRAQENYEGAVAAGLQVGVYFYSQAISPEEAREEAQFAAKIIKKWELSYPVVYDWEWVSSDARTGSMTGEAVTACTQAFCREMEKQGYDAAFYFNQDLAENTFVLEKLTDYDFWLAQYENALTFPYRVKMWQFTASGSVPGISGNVDLNLYFE